MYLAELRGRTEPIRVGVVGIGRMGRGVVDQVSTMAGIRVMAAADVDLGRAEACLRENGAEPVVTDQLGPAQDALRIGRPVATGDGGLMPPLELDPLVQATGLPEVGARVAADAIENLWPVVMLYVEPDLAVGRRLDQRASRGGGGIPRLANATRGPRHARALLPLAGPRPCLQPREGRGHPALGGGRGHGQRGGRLGPLYA